MFLTAGPMDQINAAVPYVRSDLNTTFTNA